MAYKVKLDKGASIDIEIGGVVGNITPNHIDIRIKAEFDELAKKLDTEDTGDMLSDIEKQVELFGRMYNTGFVDDVIAKHGLTMSVYKAIVQGIDYAFKEIKKA